MPKPDHLRKRSRYVAQACDRCKTAKVRCDGGLPCAYCRARDAGGCRYNTARFPIHAPSRGGEENIAVPASVSALLQQQTEKLDFLIQRMTVLDKASNGNLHPSSTTDTGLSTPKQPLPLFQSSTSSFFCFDLLDTNLKPREHHTPESDQLPYRTSFSILQGEILDGESSVISGNESEATGSTSSGVHDPIDELGGSDVVRLMHIYQDMIGFMYPILDFGQLVRAAEKVFGTVASSRTDFPGVVNPGPPQMDGSDMALLKMIIAIALAVENEAHAALAGYVYQSLRQDVEAMVWNTKVDLKGLVLLTLASLYDFSRSKWRLAWRLISNLTRIILELGLNRLVVLDRSFPDPSDRAQAVNTIWTVYVLDQHLSYALGLSMALRDMNLDPAFPPPVDAPYLTGMIEYARIGGPACDDLLSEIGKRRLEHAKWQESYAFFEYRLSQWEQRIDNDFQLAGDSEQVSESNQLLRTIFQLRANHLRVLIARSFLCANLRTVAPLDIWDTSVNVAANTIHMLAHLDHSGKTYRFQQTQFNYFLIACLGILLLTVTQESSKTAGPSSNGQRIPVSPPTLTKAQQSAMVALNLIYSQSESSRHSRGLWECVRRLACRLNISGYLIPSPPSDSASGIANGMPETAISQRAGTSPAGLGQTGSDWNENMCTAGSDSTFSPFDFTTDLGIIFDNSFFSTNM
ncbi:hypothetical protein NA57DRAFT_59864 [Rhizodiscina lignyota]|uniref:Zn(2)-C6 fungal-type domain-containing protein n=1 Tax=Rhizodiscina lignyota TaxID=1504668 RepID=A0A9P4IAR2_9PEZI|nr:hypothetical protein NA57DRAFT_59864 [Rhizodiscina lignyota]